MSVKVFIAQPILGRTEEQIEEERTSAIKDISVMFGYDDVEVVNDICLDLSLKSLSKSFSEMADANVIYFCKGWRQDVDCDILYKIAVRYDLYTIESMLEE